MIEYNPFSAPVPSEKPRIEHILYWVWEREAIRIAKENGYTGELTKDPILKQYRFCNVRRKDDRVSKWIFENILSKMDSAHDDIWFASAVARFINWPPTLSKLLTCGVIQRRAEDFDKSMFCELVNSITASGEKAWTSAYIVRAVEALPGMKVEIVKNYLQSAIDHRKDIRESVVSNSVESVVNILTECYGYGTFMAGQVAADLTYTDALINAEDLYSWAPLGPGSQRGLNRLNERNLSAKWAQHDFNAALKDINNCLSVELKIEPLTLHDVQNVMCEMDKYWRVLYNEGRPRATYKPETAF